MYPFLHLIRFPNLLMIAFIQCTMRYAVIFPLAQSHGVAFQLSGFTFFCIVISTMCTAAAGYAINDYFDLKTDTINRPDKVLVGKSISRRKTMLSHIILGGIGILLGGYVTWAAGIPKLVLAYIVVAGMLWLYSMVYKRLLIIGNVIVALFFAFVPIMVLLDIPPIYEAYGQLLMNQGVTLNFAVFWILGVALFVFMTALSLDIIKDAENFEGDVAYGCRSLPVVLGDRYTKWTMIGINIVLVAMLGVAYGCFLRHLASSVSLFYLLIFLVIPLMIACLGIHRASTVDDYHRTGNLMKRVMFAGIAYSFVLWFVMW